MQEKIIFYMSTVKRPVDIHDISKEINEKEIELLDVLKEMKERGVIRLLAIPLNSQIKSSTYYELI